MASRSSEFLPTIAETGIGLPDVDENVVAPIVGVAFWSAITLPFLHLPLLLVTGLSSGTTTTAFVVLLALNVCALLVGHPHYRE